LATHFANIYSKKYLKPDLSLDAQTIKKLKQYSFPGNVRELQYTMERAVIMSENEALSASDLIFSPIESAAAKANKPEDLNLSMVEKNTIRRVIEKHKGNISRAAK
jgi:DNA-binding NtrC family response regulator